MKKGLLGSTALIAATALTAGMAQAQEAPTVSLGGFMNFQIYFPDQDVTPVDLGPTGPQDEAVAYFLVDDAELTVNISGTADNGLTYGGKIEFEASPGGGNVADEARIQLGGSWGTLQMGDEDGAEDIMNYGGENVMGATGGFDGDQDDWFENISAATSFPTIAGDTSDATKLTYYSPRFSGFQVGASFTPVVGHNGGAPALDGANNNSWGLGANYDGSFGDVRVRASVVFVTDEAANPAVEDNSAFSVGAIVGFGPVQVGANWTDNGESGSAIGSGLESSYWDAAVGFETGPLYLSAGYLAAVADTGGGLEDEYNHIAVTADYTVAPGLTVYAEYADIESKIDGGATNDGTGVTLGVNLSF